jgi:hypothetical protein
MADNEFYAPSESIVRTLWELVSHIILVTAAFLVILIFAIALDQLLHWLHSIGLLEKGTPLEWGLIGAKYALFSMDIALLGVLLCKYGWRAARKL